MVKSRVYVDFTGVQKLDLPAQSKSVFVCLKDSLCYMYFATEFNTHESNKS